MQGPAQGTGNSSRCRFVDACRAVWVLLPLAAGLQAAEPRLLPAGAPWRFWIVGSNAPPPVADWRTVPYDDSGWANGLSGFSISGDEATYLNGSNLTSVLFRGRFMLDDPAAVQWLILRADYVGGFVAYLNGHEVTRRGVEGDPPPPDAVAVPHARYATEELDVSAHRHRLVTGTNVLAIQFHSATLPATSLVLVPELFANFQRGPMLQNVTASGATILWRTPVAATSAVEFGATPALGQWVADERLTTNHVMTLGGLSPGTEHYYRVVSAKDTQDASSVIHRFRTLRAAGDISFAVFGDSGSGWMPQLQVASCLATSGVDLVLHTGDITYWSFNRAIADTRCLSIYGPQMRGTPFFFTPGNHDHYADPLVTYFETFRMPTNAATGTSHFYSFDHGDAHFVSLYVPTLMNFAGMAPYALAPGSTQLRWLTNDLAATTRPWRIVILHSPLFNSAGHRFDDYNYNSVPDRLELQQWLLPVLSQFGVQVVFGGHDHSYERLAPTNGIHCFVSGGGGYTLYGLAERDALSRYFEPRFHHLSAAITGELLEIRAVDRYGAVFDAASIPRVSPPRLRACFAGETSMRFEWNSAPASRYAVESSETPTGPFLPLEHPGLPLTATSYQAAYAVDLRLLSGQPSRQFFRVRLLP
jgi:hypothetical protein